MMTDNDQSELTPDPDPVPPASTMPAGIMTATGDLAVTPGTDSDQEAREDQ